MEATTVAFERVNWPEPDSGETQISLQGKAHVFGRPATNYNLQRGLGEGEGNLE